MRHRVLLAILLLLFLNHNSTFSQSPDEVTADLFSYVTEIRQQMPLAGSNRFVEPTEQELAAWRPLVRKMLEGQYQAVAESLAVRFPFYRLVKFTDTGNERNVCYLLQEKTPIAKGWGTYMFNPEYKRELCIQSPHPVHDTDTHTQGAEVFRHTGARTFLLAGTHRCASPQVTPCDGSSNQCGDGKYHVSDVAHFHRAMFQITHEEIVRYNPQTYAINLHGNSSSNCPDIYLSNGALPSHRMLFDMKTSILTAGGLTMAVNGDGTSPCTFGGTLNVQGRFINGSPEPCTVAATSPTGYFIHIEQSRTVRSTKSEYDKLIAALNAAIPLRTSVDENKPRKSLLAPEQFQLYPNYPNPFRDSTTLQYRLAVSAEVTLKIFDVEGRLVKVLHEKAERAPNHYNLVWDGRDGSGNAVASGSYLVQLEAGEWIAIKRATLMR